MRNVVIGINAARQALAAGDSVVVLDRAERLEELLAERTGRGRLAVLAGDPDDPAALEAARAMAEELFTPAS